MLIDYQVEGYKIFSNSVTFSMEASNYIKKNKENTFPKNKTNILKSSLIYGPNNTGKSAFISSIKLLKNIILGNENIKNITENFLNYNYYIKDNDKKMKFKIDFLIDDEIFQYGLTLQYLNGIQEEYLKIDKELIFDRNDIENTKIEIKPLMEIYQNYKDKLIVSTLPNQYQIYTEKIKDFFENIIIFQDETPGITSLHDFYMEGIYEFLKDSNKKDIHLFNQFVKNADISIEKLKLVEENNEMNNLLKIRSIHQNNNKKIETYSIFSESDGSKKFMRYIIEIIKSFKTGKIILIDEIDNSFHTLLTKSILTLFNSEDNHNTQLIATSHDLLLLDTEYLFRKDQIWFIYNDKEEVYLYSLNDIADNDGARNKTMTSYLKGMFGALPNPRIGDLFSENK